MVQISTHALNESDIEASNPGWGFDPGDSFTFNPGTMPFYDVEITDTGAAQSTLSGDVSGTNSDGGPNSDNEGSDGETATITDQSGTPFGTQGQRVAVDKSGVLSGSDGSTINIYELETYDNVDLYVFSAPLVAGVTYTVVSNVHDVPMPYGSIVCFVAGTLIATPNGPVPVEMLAPGDPVLLADGRTTSLVWTGARRVRRQEMATQPNLAPIRIARNTLGRHETLMVSAQHRIFLSGEDARTLAGVEACLVSAKLLAEEIGGPIRRVIPDRSITYHHLMCPRHEIVLANGVPAETFYPGKAAISMCTLPARMQLYRLYPELAGAKDNADVVRIYGPTKAPCVQRKQIRATRQECTDLMLQPL